MAEVSSQSLLDDRYHSIMIVGNYKSGKTYSLVTMMEHLDKHNGSGPKNLYLFDMDGDGSESLITALEKRGHRDWIKRPEDGGRLRVFRYNEARRNMLLEARPTRSMDPFMNFVNDLNSVANRHDGPIWKDPATAPGCVVIDPCTSLSEITFDYILVKRGKELGGSREQGGDTDPTAPKKYVEPGDWVTLQEKILDMIKTIKAMPCHRIVMFHEELTQEMIAGTMVMRDKNAAHNPKAIDPIGTGRLFNLPALSGKLQGTIGKNFSDVLYTRYIAHSDPNKAYKWRARPSEQERIGAAGSRFKQDLPEVMDQNFCLILD